MSQGERRLLLTILGVVVVGGIGVGAYLLGKSSDDDEPTIASSPADSTDGEPSEELAASANRTIKVGSQGVKRLGSFQPQNQSPVEAADEFGPPSYVGPNDELCTNEWRDLGLLINFANLGGADPCSADGRVGSIELKDEFAAQAGWETEQGVHVGMSLEQLREIYPDAQTQSFPGLGKALVLIEGPTIIGGGGTYPVLSARIAGGAVDELRMSVGAAGD